MSSSARFQRVGRHSWAVTGSGDDVQHSFGSNQAITIGGRSSLVYDTGFHNRTSQRLLERMKSSNTRKIIVVNSHYHSDHSFGNTLLSKAGGLIIAQKNCSQTIRRRSSLLLDRYRQRDLKLFRLLRGVEIVPPDINYRDRLSVQLGKDLEAEIIHPGQIAHTDGDSIVLVSPDKVVFAGDILWTGYHPNLEDADIQGQIQSLRMILRLKARRIVPGHGPVSGSREAKRQINYLQQLDKNIRAGTRKGLRDGELVRYVIPRWSWDWKMRWLMESYITSLARKQ